MLVDMLAGPAMDDSHSSEGAELQDLSQDMKDDDDRATDDISDVDTAGGHVYPKPPDAATFPKIGNVLPSAAGVTRP